MTDNLDLTPDVPQDELEQMTLTCPDCGHAREFQPSRMRTGSGKHAVVHAKDIEEFFCHYCAKSVRPAERDTTRKDHVL